MLKKLRNDMNPEFIAVCFDLKGPTMRHEKFADYKVHRRPMPEELVLQMPVIKEIVNAYGISIFQLSGYEADDLIATLAVRLKKRVDVYIVSGDKDMLQLVDDRVKIYNPQKDQGIIDAEKVFQRFGVTPGQITDLLALTGDSSDNIPGVPGIGFKTAAQLLQDYGSLDGIFRNIDKISQKKRKESLEESREQAKLSRELATVISDAPINIDMEALKCQAEDKATLLRIFKDLDLRTFYQPLLARAGSLEKEFDKEEISSVSEFKALAEKLKAAEKISLLLSPASEDNGGTRFLDIGVPGDRIFTVKLNKSGTADLQKYLKNILEKDNPRKTGYDLKSISLFFKKQGLDIRGLSFDCMIAAYLLEPSAGRQKIEEITFRYLNRPARSNALVLDLLELEGALGDELTEKDLGKLFNDVEMPLSGVLAEMEYCGIKVDVPLLKSLKKEMDGRLAGLTANIYKLAGCEFNINSPKQLSEILFEKLGLPVIKKGKSGPSTNHEVLARLSAEHELPAMILEYRETAKLQSTYVIGLLELADKATGRIHTSFNQTVTATGRLSSSEPNLQNIPVRTDAGRRIRAAFIAGAKDRLLLSADYSQIELRILAHLADDGKLIDAFRQGLDIHNFTASLVFGVEMDKVESKMRTLAKRVNFGIIYGMGPFALARDLDISHKEAKEFIANYFKRYPAVEGYLKRQIEEAQKNGFVTTLLNRRRYIPQIKARDAISRSFAERTAMNTPVQGTAADLIKAAMVRVFERFKKQKLQAEMLLQVHDELVFDVSRAELETVSALVKDSMENVLQLKVPVEVGIKVGKNWREMEEIGG